MELSVNIKACIIVYAIWFLNQMDDYCRIEFKRRASSLVDKFAASWDVSDSSGPAQEKKGNGAFYQTY